MTCRRICRELLSFVRFGELGPSSQPHLDHLAGCQPCRDEVGYDREMVQRLRQALAARVEGMDPSPTVWEQILVRAQAPDADPESGWVARLAGIAGRRRSTTAMAGTALALVLALNMQVVPLAAPRQSDATGTTTVSGPQAVKRAPGARAATALPRVETEIPPADTQPRREVAMTGLVAAFEPPAVTPAEDAVTQLHVVVHPPAPLGPLGPLGLDDHGEDRSIGTANEVEPEPLEPPATPEPGQPS
jgi:hypothetical protein